MKTDASFREKEITRTSVIGIVANILLSTLKAIAGLIAGSIAIVLDAVNNLTDATSSIITIIGVKLAKRPPDKSHPFGHGRIEYFSALIIAAIVVSAGVMSLVESVKKIISPETPDYSVLTVAIVGAAVITKLFLGRFVKAKGKQLNSDALVASGADATFDAFLSIATLLGASITLIWGVTVDGIVGALISLFIIKAGVEMLMQPLHSILGKRADSEVTKGITKLIESIDGVEGVYDLILHNYGPNYAIGSVHVEVCDTMSAKDIHVLTNNIQVAVISQYHVFLTVGIYAVDTQDKELADIRATIRKCALAKDGVLNVHGIFINRESKTINFDVLVDFEISDRAELIENITKELAEACPGYTVCINIDNDYSDL